MKYFTFGIYIYVLCASFLENQTSKYEQATNNFIKITTVAVVSQLLS